MNLLRIKEIQQFADEFNSKLKSANNDFSIKLHKPVLQTPIQTYCKPKKKTKCYSSTMIMEQESWKPTRAIGSYFSEFKKLSNQYELNQWEMIRVPHLSQRSFAKSKDFASKKDILPTKAVGQDFDQHMKRNASMIQLSTLGQSIIDNFVLDNINKETKLRFIEQKLWEYRHTKRPIELNPWKNSYHIINEFSVPPLDKIHSYRIINKKKQIGHLKPIQ